MDMDYNRHEVIIPNDDISFRLFLFEGNEGNYFRARHWHQSIEIFALLEGELDFFLDDVRIHMTPGQFVLVNSMEIHSIHALRPNQSIVLQIPVSTFRRYYQDNAFIYFSHSVQDANEQVMNLVREIYEAYQAKQIGYELMVQSLFYQLLYLLVLKYWQADPDKEIIRKLQNRSRLSDITDYVKHNYYKALTLENLGVVFGYSSAYISRMFKKYAGSGFKKYLNSIRLAHAVQDLIMTEKTMDVIAMQNGFPDRRAMNRAFQETYHITPQQYRKSAGVLSDVQSIQKE